MINVNMTDKAGVTLATAEKYCADNVKVTPSAEILRKDEQAKTATPTTSAQDITPDAGKALSKVTVNPITAAIVGDLDADSFAPAIVAAIEGKGVTVPDGTLLDGMAALIEGIQAGGGTTYGTYTPSEDLNIYIDDIVIETGNTHASNGIIYCEDFKSLSYGYDMLFLVVVDGVAIGTRIYGKNGPMSFAKDPSVNNGGFFLGKTNEACDFIASKKYVWVVW